jgi:hypothetical protein
MFGTKIRNLLEMLQEFDSWLAYHLPQVGYKKKKGEFEKNTHLP